MRACNKPRMRGGYRDETKLMRLWPPAPLLEEGGHDLGAFRGNSNTFFAFCLLRTQVCQV